MFSTGRQVRLLRDLDTKHALIKAGTCGCVMDQIESNLYKVQFVLRGKVLFSVEVLEHELERVK